MKILPQMFWARERERERERGRERGRERERKRKRERQCKVGFTFQEILK